MENTIRRIIQAMIETPTVKDIIVEALNETQYNIDDDVNSLSSIRIDEDCRIFLTEYDNAELIIDGYQAKALYLFYLLSPVGISNTEIEQYENVLIDIYFETYNRKGRTRGRAEDGINGLLRPKKNKKGRGLSDAANKIRNALKKIIEDDDVLKKYIITGKRGCQRRILLPDVYVIVENEVLQEIRKTAFTDKKEEYKY